jgi:hypothetical protein
MEPTFVRVHKQATSYLWRMFRKVLQLVMLAWVQLYLFAPELMKLPMLVAHYQEHRSSADELTLKAFLDLHYADNGHEEADHEGHESLPFHHHHGTGMDACACKVWTSAPRAVVSFPQLLGDRPQGPPEDGTRSQGHPPAPFQPPRALA